MPDIPLLEIAGLLVAAVGFFFVWWRLRDVEKLKSELENQSKTVEELRALRAAAHSEIWTLTGALNLFGPSNDIDLSDLSRKMATWYFTSGEALGDACRDHYFLIQEAIGLCQAEGIETKRPEDGRILGAMTDTDSSAISRLDRMRKAALGPAAQRVSDSEGRAVDRDLRHLMNDWRIDPGPIDAPGLGHFTTEERAWLLLQWLMSLLRSRIRAGLKGV